MVIKTASPGIVINEVDLTKGTSDAITSNIGAICGPFQKGPVGELVLIDTEAELQRVFGDPTDENYEYWWSVSNFLEYGGVCYVVRTDDSVGDSSGTFLQTMKSATDEIVTDTPIYVKNKDDFEENWYQAVGAPGKFIARSPGAWGNALAVAVIDHGADYQVSLKTTGIVAAADGAAVTDDTAFASGTAGGTVVGEYVRLIGVTGITAGTYIQETDGSGTPLDGEGIVISEDSGNYLVLVTAGTFTVGSEISEDGGTTELGPLTAVYPVGSHTLYDLDATDEDVLNTIWTPNTYTAAQGAAYGWAASPISGQKVTTGGPAAYDAYVWYPGNNAWVLQRDVATNDLLTDGTNVYQVQAGEDWYTQQIAFGEVPWYRFASRPGTSSNARDVGATNDELNIIVYDATGAIAGVKGNLLESYFGVSKLAGTKDLEGGSNYYIDVINNLSNYVFANQVLEGPTAGINTSLSAVGTTVASGVNAVYINVETLTLANGVDNYAVSLGELQDAYNKFTIEAVPELDYVIQGPGMGNLDDSIAKANFIISVIEERRDCMAFLSPPRLSVIGQASQDIVSDNIVTWAEQLASSSYAVLDSGYKYTYDRFNDKYRYLPLNADIAGLMVFTTLTAEPWYSPAGMSRGQIRNVVKLPFNPNKKQRDALYTARVNPVATFPGEGTILFGDKTALGYSSAFDRINVRKLFLVIEDEVAKIARTNLFEFNDDVTRSLFKNNVNPFLRDIQAKRGMYDFLVVCDETNNTPEIIDRNEFVADIYIKPAKSINFITLNFVATKTGVTFDESVALFRGN